MTSGFFVVSIYGLHDHAAIHRERLPGNVLGLRARQEGDGGGDILRLAEAAQRDLLDDGALDMFPAGPPSYPW